MNKKEFSLYLHQPQLIDKNAEMALQEVVNDFPYFHAAHQLLLKAHQNNGSYHFERQLPITSLLHGNRKLLYAYLKDSLVREYHLVTQNDLFTSEEIFNEIANAPESLESNPMFNQEALEIPKSESIVVPENNVQNVVEENEREQETVNEGKEATIEMQESLIVLEDIDLPFQNFEEKYLNKVEVEAKVEHSEDSEQKHDGMLSQELEFKEKPLTIEEEKVISTIEPHDFLTWLQAKKTDISHTPKPIEKEEIVKPTVEPKEDITGENSGSTEKKIKKFNSLIDKFIETSPSISKPQPTKFYNPAEKAKESITENFDLVTETLAKIYTRQKNYKKAILVYEKLSLLYPEKMSYFAAQISELQTLLNK